MNRTIFWVLFFLSSFVTANVWSAVTASPNPSNTGNFVISWPSGQNSSISIKRGSVEVATASSSDVQASITGQPIGNHVYEVIAVRGYCNPYIGGCVPRTVGKINMTVIVKKTKSKKI